MQERKSRDQLPSEEEVRARLDRLKGVQQAGTEEQQGHFYHPPDSRTDAEQTHHLINAAAAKVTRS